MVPTRSACRAASADSVSTERPASLRMAWASACDVLATFSTSGGRLRNAMPSPLVSRIGKKMAQKTASGSRTNSRTRTSVSCTSGCPRIPNGRRTRGGRPLRTDASLVISEMSSGERYEDVLERGRVRPKLGERQALPGQLREKGRYHSMELGCLDPQPTVGGLDVADARQQPDRIEIDGSAGVARGTLHDMLYSNRGNELTRSSSGDDLAVVHDRHAIREALGFFHIVCRQENRAAGPLELVDEIPELPAGLRIEPGRRFVEEQQVRIADKRAREREPLLLSPGEHADPRVTLFLQLNQRDEV